MFTFYFLPYSFAGHLLIFEILSKIFLNIKIVAIIDLFFLPSFLIPLKI